MERFSIKRFIRTIWDHHFGRETAEERLNLNVYTGRMTIQKFGRLLSELLGHRLARIDVQIEPFFSRFSRRSSPIYSTSRYLPIYGRIS